MANAIVVQCFNKADTLQGLCMSLLGCERTRDFNLIFWSDSVDGSKRAPQYAEKNKIVMENVRAFASQHASRFNSITIKQNDKNLGTCMTCRVALDAAFSDHDFVVFTEDDTVFCPDALSWFLQMREIGVLNPPEVIAIAGESIFFDARKSPVSAEYSAEAKLAAIERGYLRHYTSFKFVPSTCFATTREKWREFGEMRGQPRGDEDVCAYCIQNNRFCIFPIVARVKDIGMLHEDGYSVANHGAANVREIKNVYLTSADLLSSTFMHEPPFLPEVFTGNGDALFRESVLLKGFKRS